MTQAKGRLAALLALVAAALLACTALALAACSSGESGQPENGTLRVGVRADIVGFGYLNEDTGKYYGLEIDIAKELGKRLGYKDVEFTTVTPDDRKEMLLDGKVDALIACYSISDTRLKNFDFSPAYYTDESVVMVENSSMIDGIDDLKGKTFGAMSGSNTAPQLAIRLAETGFSSGQIVSGEEGGDDVAYDTFRLVQLPSYQALSDALEEGTIDAACMDGAIAHTYMNDDRSTLSDFSIYTQDYGVATQKGSALSQPVADAVQSMLDDGSIAALIDKWN